MRILLPVHIYLPEHRAGVETYTEQLARELAKSATVTIATTRKIISRKTGSLRRREVNGIPVVEVVNNLSHERFEDTWCNPRMEAAFSSILEEVRPDVVHFQHLMYWSWGLPRLARAAGARCLATLHDYWLICPRFGQLVDFRGEPCDAPEETRCAECMAHTPYGQSVSARRWIRRLSTVRRFTGVALDRPMRALARLQAKLARGTPHDSPVIDLEPWRASYHRRREALADLSSELDLAVTPSRTLRDGVVKEGFPSDRIRVVPQGLDPAPFQGMERTSSSTGRLRLGFLGTIAPHKGLHTLVEAVQRLPQDRVELRIWGPATQHEDYARQLRQRAGTHPNIQFLGVLAKSAVPQAYREVDIACIPSLWNECCPLTIQEALMARVPCVVSGKGGMAELIRDGVDGLHAVPGDVMDWERALRRLLDESHLVDRMASAIRPVPTMAEHAKVLLDLYQSDAPSRLERASRPG